MNENAFQKMTREEQKLLKITFNWNLSVEKAIIQSQT